MQTIIYIFPELFLSLSIMTILMVGVFVKKSFKLVNLLTIATLIFTSALVLNQQNETIKIFNDSYIIDNFSMLMKKGGKYKFYKGSVNEDLIFENKIKIIEQ